MARKNKKLTLKDTENVASLFVGDLIRYYKAGGDMKNLTAKKVYSLLRKTDEKAFDQDELLADIETVKETLKGYPYLDDNKESRELVDLMLDIDLTEEDENFLLEKLNLSGDEELTEEQTAAYIKEALKLRGIREEDSYQYIKAVYHNTDEEVDYDELCKDENENGD